MFHHHRLRRSRSFLRRKTLPLPGCRRKSAEILGYDKATELIKESDDIYLQFGADQNVYGVDKQQEIRKIRKKAINANLKLIECPIRHLGTEEGYKIYTRLQDHLLANGIHMEFNTMVKDIIIEDGAAKGVITDKDETYYADEIVSAIGREGSDWFSHICDDHGIDTEVGTVDIGVRVEVRDEVMEFLNKNLYEAKLVYYTPTFDDKVRTFCTNPSGEVATEYYENGLAVVNGHAYKSKEYKTNNTNFAILVSKNFTKPFKTPIEYGKHIAQLSNMLCDGKILVQTFGDFQRGRRTTEERLCRNNIIPTLKDAVPGDLSLVLPHRIMVDIKEMLKALDKVTPGIASDETLLYGVEVKFYSNKVVCRQRFRDKYPWSPRDRRRRIRNPRTSAGIRERTFRCEKYPGKNGSEINDKKEHLTINVSGVFPF